MPTDSVAECHFSPAYFEKKQPSTSSSSERAAPILRWCRRPSLDLSMTVNTVLTPSMTSSNSMSSGYCSLDDESEDFTFFTAKTSFFRKPRHAAKVLNQSISQSITRTDEIVRVRQTQMGQVFSVSVWLGNKLFIYTKKHATEKQKCGEEVVVVHK